MAQQGQIDFWNDRYGTDLFAYGTEPNDFLKECIEGLIENNSKPSNQKRSLCICDGEGRNSIYLARKGYSCDSVDLSMKGMQKLNDWAIKENLSDRIHTTVCDLHDYIIKENEYDIIVSSFAHTSVHIRSNLHNNIHRYLKVGGYFVLEAYTENNLGRGVGGPQTIDTCMNASTITGELNNMNIIKSEDLERFCQEGIYHKNDRLAAVMQCLAVKI